jgi:DHA1 family tetracycline resistance protein-like MFS transporter
VGEPWYLSCLFLSVAFGGIAPMLLPLRVILGEDSPAHVGLVMAAIGLGGLTSAAWGDLADRFDCHRQLFVGGLLVAVAALALFPVAPSVEGWIGLGLLLGAGAAATNTIATLFVVEAYDGPERDRRIGRLQAFTNGGSAGGLLLAGALSHLPLESYLELDLGLLIGAALTAVAALIAWRTLPTLSRRTSAPSTSPPTTNPAPPGPAPAEHLVANPLAVNPVSANPKLAARLEWPVHLFRAHFPHPTRQTLRRLGPALRSRFTLLLLVWFVGNAGINAVYTLYPLLAAELFAIEPGPASLIQAAGFWASLALYWPTGRLVTRLGPIPVLGLGFALRLAVLFGLLGLAAEAPAAREWPAAAGFVARTLAFPLLGVSSAALASRLSPLGAGEGMGVYATVGQLAGLVGPLLGGYVAQWAGYDAVLGTAAAALGGALLLTALLAAARRPNP